MSGGPALGAKPAAGDEPDGSRIDEPEGEAQQRFGRWRWARRSLSRLWLLGALLALVAIFSLANPDAFLSSFNLRSILIATSVLLIMAVGQTFVISAAGIDLSIGSVLVFSGVVSARFMEANGGLEAGTGVIVIGCVIAIASGLAWGFINGSLIAVLKLPPLIVTLGTYGAALGLAQVIAGGIDVRTVPEGLTSSLGFGEIAGLPLMVWIAGVTALIGGILLFKTRFGMRTLAIGSDPEAVRRSGISVSRQLIRIYMLQGALAGLAGLISLSRFATTTINGHATDNLNAIAGVVLGGTSLFGGIATMLGTVIGILIPSTLFNGLVIIGLDSFWQGVVVGVVLIAAVYIDQAQRRRRRRA